MDSAINRVLPELHGRARHMPPKPQMPVRRIIPAGKTKRKNDMNTNTMISAGRIAASTEAWTTSPAVMALTDEDWGVLAGLHFAGDDVLMADVPPRVVAAYLSGPGVTRPPAKMPHLMLRVTRCADPAAWHSGRVGELVKFVCAGVGCWMARDDAGTLQRIDLEDADLVEVRGGVVSSIVS